MNLLEKIDSIYEYETKKYTYGIDKNFSIYIPVKPINIDSLLCTFLIKKQKKAKMMLCDGKQRIYLSDIDIIKIILNTDCSDWFIEQLVRLYRDICVTSEIQLDNEKYTCRGISYYPNKKHILLFSDSLIDINDLIFIMNFIFEKDKLWGQIADLPEFNKTTICKYITLIDYYTHKISVSTDFLKSIGYPLKNKEPIDTQYTITETKAGQNKKIKKKIFKNIETFDISQYL